MKKIARDALLNNHKDAIADIHQAIEIQGDALKSATKAILAILDEHNDGAPNASVPRHMKHLARLRSDIRATLDLLRYVVVGLDASTDTPAEGAAVIPLRMEDR
jgi:hypothetical protein